MVGAKAAITGSIRAEGAVKRKRMFGVNARQGCHPLVGHEGQCTIIPPGRRYRIQKQGTSLNPVRIQNQKSEEEKREGGIRTGSQQINRGIKKLPKLKKVELKKHRLRL